MENLHIEKILVPVDFSDSSMNALHTATETAKYLKASLKLIFVNDSDNKFYPDINLNKIEDIVKALSTLAKNIKRDENIECSYTYFSGSVTNGIIDESINMNADLIIMGKNGNAGIRKMFAGSCAYGVMKRSLCPVMIVPSGKMWNRFNNVLFPVRPEISMLEKYSSIKEIMDKSNSLVHLLSMRNPDVDNELHINSKLIELLKKEMARDQINFSISYYFKDNKFAENILDITADPKRKIDLLVIASEPDADNQTFYLTPYQQQIIHQSNVPVLIMKANKVRPLKDELLYELEKKLNYN